MMNATPSPASPATMGPKLAPNQVVDQAETMRVLINVEGLAEEGFVTLAAIAKAAAAYIAPMRGLESVKALLRLIDETADKYADCIDGETERLRGGKSSVCEVH